VSGTAAEPYNKRLNSFLGARGTAATNAFNQPKKKQTHTTKKQQTKQNKTRNPQQQASRTKVLHEQHKQNLMMAIIRTR
jgi:hypothetical protein